MVKSKKGFTLIEVLMALLILGILFIPVSRGVILAVKINQQTHQRLTALREQQAQLEITRVLLEAVDSDQLHHPHFDHTPLLQLNGALPEMHDTNVLTNVTTLRVLQLPGKKPWNSPRYIPLPEDEIHETE